MRTLSGLFHHVRRGDYGTFKLFSADRESEGLFGRLKLHAIDLTTRQMPDGVGVGAALALVGLLLTLLRLPVATPVSGTAAAAGSKGGTRAAGDEAREAQQEQAAAGADAKTSLLAPVGFAVIATLTFYQLVFHFLSNMPLDDPLLFGVHARFWQQPNFIIFVYFGIGFAGLCSALPRLVGGESSGGKSTTKTKTNTNTPPKTGKKKKEKEKKKKKIVKMSALAAACALVAVQGARSWEEMNQHDAWYFNGYARAVVEPLPPNALLFINYDMQWTSVRYLQQCEGLRSDVDSINLSMLTFGWFEGHRDLYPHLTFPGTHLSLSSPTGFSFDAFLEANLERRCAYSLSNSNSLFLLTLYLSPFSRMIESLFSNDRNLS